MSLHAPDIPEFGFRVGDHICAFYNEGGDSLDDIIVDYVCKGLQAGDKCVCMIDTASSVRDRIPGELVSRDGILQFVTEDEGYLPEGHFSKDTFIRSLEAMVQGVLSARNAVDMKSWVAAESEVNELAPRYPQFLMCLYNLNLFDGEAVMYVLKTHPRIFVNGMIIANPYYIPRRQFPASL
jgi:hypothetical protein